MKPIEDLEKARDVSIDDIDDELNEVMRSLRMLEQKREDATYDFKLSMFNRCWDMVIDVMQFHFPDVKIRLNPGDHQKLRKRLAKGVGVQIRKKDLPYEKIEAPDK